MGHRDRRPKPKDVSMLRQRVITATILCVVVILPMFLAPSWAWGLLVAGGLWLAGREWQRLILPASALLSVTAATAPPTSPGPVAAATGPAIESSPRGSPTWLANGLLVVAIACLWWRESDPGRAQAGWQNALLVLDMLFWLLFAVPAVFRARPFPFGARTFAAVSLFCLWLGLYELRRIDPKLVLTVMMVVWIADIGAYFVGRAFGRRKLAPRVSPGKSWEGALGGLVVVLLVAFTALALIPADSTLAAVFPRWLVERAGIAATVLVLVAMVALSVIGDLHESLLKRARGVKDSGRIFPGHGGVLDRIDALIPTVPLALLVIQGMIGGPE
jgi:phosphatidate cytidylyltransferase